MLANLINFTDITPSVVKLTDNIDPECEKKILEVLTGGDLWFSELRIRGQFGSTKLKRHLDCLENDGLIRRTPQEHRINNSIEPRGNRWLAEYGKQQEQERKDREAVKNQYPMITPEEWKEFEKDLEEAFEDWFNFFHTDEMGRSKKIDYSKIPVEIMRKLPRGFHLEKFPIKTPRYKGFITISWEPTGEKKGGRS